MTPSELADKWDADAALLTQTARAYRAGCHNERRGLYLGKAAALRACAIQLRTLLPHADTTQATPDPAAPA